MRSPTKELIITTDLSIANNNFNMIRWFAAIAVIFSHAFPLYLSGSDPIGKISHSSIGELAVNVFFMISGFLITLSYLRSGSWSKFLVNRILRIAPALIGVRLITMLLIGPIASDLSSSLYFQALWHSGLNMIKVQHPLPGVFEHNLFPYAVNSSLWTISWEFKLYLVVLVLGFLKLLNKHVAVVGYLATTLLYLLFSSGMITTQGNLLRFTSYFFAGMIMFFYRDKFDKLPTWFILGTLVAYITSFILKMNTDVFCVFGPVLLYKLSFVKNEKLNTFGSNIDLSYGIYLYAFPIQQVIEQYFPTRFNMLENFLIVTGMTVICALFSWEVIEKRCMALKKYWVPNKRMNQIKI